MVPNLEFVRAAISSKDGEVQLHLSEGVGETGEHYSGSSSLHPPGALIKQYWPKMEFNKAVPVPGITMDTLMERLRLPHIDFIWCDTQGCEDEAIKGGPKAFAASKFFFTEYADAPIYDGQATFTQIRAMLPTWVVDYNWGGDALLRNTVYAPNQILTPPTD
jgi:FkbM family methyltransferase